MATEQEQEQELAARVPPNGSPRPGEAEAFRVSLNLLPDAALFFALDGTILEANPPALKLLEADEDALIGTTIYSLGLIEAEKTRDAVAHFARGASIRFELDFLTLKGGRRRVDITYVPVMAAGGKVSGVIGFARNITELTHIESERALMTALVESSGDAIMSLALDGTITSWNHRAEEMFGFTQAEAIGQHFLILVPPQHSALAIGMLKEVQANRGRVINFDGPALRKDRSIVEISMTLCGVYNQSGILLGVSSILRDITQRKAAESEQRMLAALVNASEDAIVGFSKEIKITSWNAAAERLYGFTAAETIGRGFDLFVSPEDLVPALEADRRLLETGEPFTYQQRTKKKDGTWFYTSVNVFAIRDAAGEIVGGAGIGRDVTNLIKLQRQQALLAAIIESSNDAIVSLSSDGRVMTWNNGAQKLFGFTVDEAIGKSILDLFVPPEDRQKVVELIQSDSLKFRDDPTFVQRLDIPCRRKDGSSVDAALVASGIHESGRNLVGISLIMRDITERQRAERERGLLAAIVESSEDAIVAAASDYTIRTWNSGAEKLYGYSAQEVIGKPMTILLPPDRQAETAMLFQKTLIGQAMCQYETKRMRKDGTLIDVSLSDSLVRDAAGATIGVAAIARDVSERKRMQEQLKHSEEYYRSLISGVSDLITVIDDSGAVRFSSDSIQKILGYRPDEVLGRQISSFVHENDRALAVEWLSNVGEAPAVLTDLRVRRKDGTWCDCESTAGIITSPDGELLRLVSTRDITDRKAQERELIAAREAALAASQAKSEFLSSMSHEIRTPMTSILGMADLLAEGQLNTEQRRYLEILGNNSHSLLDLINSILDLAKVESGRLTLEHVAFDLSEVVEKSAQTLAFRAHAKQLDLIVSIAPDVPSALVGDPLRLHQVLINLIGNAIKFTEHGEVLISVQRDCAPGDPLRLKFSVRDTGIGIAEHKLPTLFNAFAQTDASTARRYGGSGLGLAIVKRLVNLMRGEVAIQSEFGKGSIFSFTSLFEPQPDPPVAAPWPDLARVPVLIVDDNQTGRGVLRQMLSGHGVSVSEAASYAAGLSAIKEAASAGRPPRFVLLDDRILIPSSGPQDLAQLIAAASQCGASIITMIHCDNLAADISQLRALNLETYLVKPIDGSELAKVFRHVLVGDTREVPRSHRSVASGDEQLAIVERPLKILFADDSSDNRALIRAFLRKTPYHLDEVENGRQAIDGFIAGDYDLVLMDIQMPEVDGYAATRAIRDWERDHNRARTPIIALTASVFRESVRLTRAAGCDAHVGKPLKKATLLRAIYDAVQAAL